MVATVVNTQVLAHGGTVAPGAATTVIGMISAGSYTPTFTLGGAAPNFSTKVEYVDTGHDEPWSLTAAVWFGPWGSNPTVGITNSGAWGEGAFYSITGANVSASILSEILFSIQSRAWSTSRGETDHTLSVGADGHLCLDIADCWPASAHSVPEAQTITVLEEDYSSASHRTASGSVLMRRTFATTPWQGMHLAVAVANADEGILSFTVPPTVTARTPTSYTIGGTLSEQGQVFAVAVPHSESAPSVAQIVAGQRANGLAAPGAGNANTTGSAPHTFSVTISGAAVANAPSHDLHYVGRRPAA